jgi:O-antigen ligase
VAFIFLIVNSMPANKHLRVALLLMGSLLLYGYVIPQNAHPYRSFFNDVLALAGLLSAFLYLAWMSSKTQVKLQIPSVVILPIALVVVICLQAWKGFVLFPADIIYPILYLISSAIALIVGATCAAYEDGLEQLGYALAITFVLAGLFSFFVQIFQLLNAGWPWLVAPVDHSASIRPYGNLRQPNLLALLLCFAIASVWYLYVMKKLKSGSAYGLAALFLIGIVLTQSRMTWIVLPLFVVLNWRQPPATPKIPRWVLVSLLFLFIVLTLVTPMLLGLTGIHIASTASRASQTSVRLILWKQALFISQLHPWTGAGWFQFGSHQAMIADLFGSTEVSDYAHNILLNLGTEIGWPLTILICVAALYWFVRCGVGKWSNVQVRFMILMISSVAVHSMVEFPLWFACFLMPFAVMIGAVHSQTMGVHAVGIGRKFTAMLLVTTLGLFSWIFFDYSRLVKGFEALNHQNEWNAEWHESIKKSDYSFVPQYFDYLHIVEVKIYPGMPNSDIRFIQRVALRFAFPPILARLAMAYAYNQQPNEALHTLIVSRQLNSNSYPDTYDEWLEFAKNNPKYFADIVNRLPKPDRTGIAE